jgi:hypothetical protein
MVGILMTRSVDGGAAEWGDAAGDWFSRAAAQVSIVPSADCVSTK